MKLGIIGNGRAAWAFANTWRRIGWPLTGIARRGEPIEELAATSDIILVAVSDRAIEEVTASIPETDAIIIHASGSLPALRGGFSLHPLKSLPPAGEPSDLEGTLLVFEGAHREVAEGRSEPDLSQSRRSSYYQRLNRVGHSDAVTDTDYPRHCRA